MGTDRVTARGGIGDIRKPAIARIKQGYDLIRYSDLLRRRRWIRGGIFRDQTGL